MSKLKIREDLNDIVKSMGFKRVKNRYGERYPYIVTLFNDVTIEFKDDANIRKMFQSYADMGEGEFIKSKALVEELKQDEEGQADSIYICVKYELKDGKVIRLFPTQLNDKQTIENYYNLYKKQKGENLKK